MMTHKLPPIVLVTVVLSIIAICSSIYFAVDFIYPYYDSLIFSSIWTAIGFLCLVNLFGLLRKRKYCLYLSAVLIFVFGIGLLLFSALVLVIGHGDLDGPAKFLFFGAALSFLLGIAICKSNKFRVYLKNEHS